MIVLGLAGHAGSGKDTVADYLVARYGFIKFSFSDALYREVAEAFGLPDESLLRDRETKEEPSPLLALKNCFEGGMGVDYGFKWVASGLLGWDRGSGVGATPDWDQPLSPRQILQWWGAEFRRAQDPGYWVRKAEEWMLGLRNLAPYAELAPQAFVNTSVRFENERAWIRDEGFDWQVDGADTRQWRATIWHLHRDAAAPVASHVSETPLPVLEGEREIFNNHTIEYLHLGVDQLMSSTARFVRLEPPLPMVEPSSLDEPLPAGTRTDVDAHGEPLPGGQYYVMQPDGHNMLFSADGTRSIFDDVDE